MPWYPRIHAAIKRVLPELLPTQATNLALSVSALLAKRTLCLFDLARAYPRPAPEQQRVPVPKAVQTILIPMIVTALGRRRVLGLAVDWTFFDTTVLSGSRMRYQVLRIAVPRMSSFAGDLEWPKAS